MSFKWTCPFCNHDTIIVKENCHQENVYLTIENADGPKVATVLFIVCPNPECNKLTLTVSLFEAYYCSGKIIQQQEINTWNLVPPSKAKVFPEFVPQSIRDDYTEACLIKDLSPKASATLARRCLQGMIRDFWGISKDRLVDEIEAIKNKVDPKIWEAIDAVRKIGNIGAHMEKDINLIIDIEPDEAEILIKLIEMLIRDWYITREERRMMLDSIVAIKDKKEAAKQS